MRRRTFLELIGAGVLATRTAPAEPEPFERHELVLEGDRRTAKNALLLVPKRAGRSAPLPLLVLLHGLGETRSVALGLRAWAELYGLVESVARLDAPPIARIGACSRCLDDARIAELDASLEREPFHGFAVVCPVTPNPQRLPPAALTLDAYAEWIERRLLPAVAERTPFGKVGIDGCSLGGNVALEVFLRRPELFATFGMVQGAIGHPFVERAAQRLADAVKRVGARPMHLFTSSDDVYRKPNEALARALEKRGVAHELEIGVGGHDQNWLREVGTLTMLLWHDRRLG